MGIMKDTLPKMKVNKDGEGIIIFPNGSVYDGWWKDDEPHGT